jgi:mRNA interferase MazF
MKKGEIWTVELPGSSGTEQTGARPSVVIAEAQANIAMIIPFTSNLQALRFENTLLISSNENNGLYQDSVLLIFQLRAIDRKRIKSKIGELEEDQLSTVNEKLRKMLKL